MSDREPTRLDISVRDAPPEGWDARLEAMDGATFCHLSGWSRIFEDVFGHEYTFLEARNPDGGLEGGLPLVRMRSLFFGDLFISLPFLNYGGPVGSTPARRALAEDAVRRTRSSGADRLVLRSRTELPNDLQRGREKVSVVLPLPDSAEALWEDGLRSKVRSQVRRPRKEGMTVRFGPEEREPFYQVFSQHMRDLGTPVLPRALFRTLPEVFGDRVEFAVVYHEEKPVAAGCGLLWNGEFEITWASDLFEYRKMAPNMLLYWSLMERVIERGARAFNFGRCTPGSGTHRFKKQWGGEDDPLAWTTWSENGADETGVPDPEEGMMSIATQVWRKLPLGVANVLGPAVARRIPTF